MKEKQSTDCLNGSANGQINGRIDRRSPTEEQRKGCQAVEHNLQY